MIRIARDGPAPPRNLRLLLAYDGSAFHGWQRQPGLRTVQACLEEALARIAGEPAHLFGSGRTDAGVHALGQVAHLATSCPIPAGNLLKALNDALPPEVRVLRAEDAPLGFHPRYDSKSKLYRYRILQAAICPPFIWRYVWHYPYPLDRRRMAQAARAFLGEHDFTSFAASAQADDFADPRAESERKSKSMVRRIMSSRVLWSERRRILVYEVEGSGFLHHMVRNIVGTLVEVGRGAMEAGGMERILNARDRTKAGPTAPAQGLCLVGVKYQD
jgi:tRNA pseudouridine38-40 synthase